VFPYVKHVLHVLDRNKRVIDCYNLDLRFQSGSAKYQATNATESVNSYFD
jgi:hypothetical protein